MQICPVFRSRKFCYVHQKFYKFENQEKINTLQLNNFEKVFIQSILLKECFFFALDQAVIGRGEDL